MKWCLFVSKRISRLMLTVVLSYLTAVLANRARLLSTLGSTTRPVLHGHVQAHIFSALILSFKTGSDVVVAGPALLWLR